MFYTFSNVSSFISSDLTALEECHYIFVLGLKFLLPVDATGGHYIFVLGFKFLLPVEALDGRH